MKIAENLTREEALELARSNYDRLLQASGTFVPRDQRDTLTYEFVVQHPERKDWAVVAEEDPRKVENPTFERPEDAPRYKPLTDQIRAEYGITKPQTIPAKRAVREVSR